MPKKIFVLSTALFFLTTRIINLSLLPVFNDEAIYISWGQKMLASGHWFFSLFDGKQPLLMWIFGLLANLFSDPLFGGRLVSVVFGLFSLLAIYRLSSRSLPTTIIYLLSPIFLFFDRQALMESALTCLGLWSLIYLVKIVRSAKFQPAVMLGVLWGAGLWVKSSFAVYITASLIIMVLAKKSKLPELITQLSIIAALTFVLLLPLLLRPDFVNILNLNFRFSFSISELFAFPISAWRHNFLSVLDISLWQTLGPLLLLLPVSAAKLWPKHKILITYFLFGLAVYVLTSKSANPRYLVSFLPPAVILTCGYISTLSSKVRLSSTALTVGWFLFLDVPLLLSPPVYFRSLNRVSAYSQSTVYLGTFTSGYGVKSGLDYLVRLAAGNSAVAAVRLDAGNPEDSTFMYLSKHLNFRVAYLTPDILSAAPPVYYVARNGQLAGFDKFLIPLAEFPKPDGVSSVVVYRLSTSALAQPQTSPAPTSPSLPPLR